MINILYVFPEHVNQKEFNNQIGVQFARISNYIHSRIESIGIKEKLVDVRCEALPHFTPKNIELYRKELVKLFKSIFENFKFNIVGISCNVSHQYLNTIEIALLLKSFINPKCIIIVGGSHATIKPEDFLSVNIPSYFYKFYTKNLETDHLFDFIIKGEGEILFMEIIQFMHNAQFHSPLVSEIKESNVFLSLDDLPPLNLDLYKKYYSKILGNKTPIGFFVDFTRGCPGRCNYCIGSTCSTPIRIRSIDNCIHDVLEIAKIKCLKIEDIYVADPTFIPNRELKLKFLKEYEKLKLPQWLNVTERIDTFPLEFLKIYKKNKIYVYFGFECGNPTILKRMNKIAGRTKAFINENTKKYIEKTHEIALLSKKLKFPITFYNLLGYPGLVFNDIKKDYEFYFRKDKKGKNLIENSFVLWELFHYVILPGTTDYKKIKYYERVHGSKFRHKEWWREFTNDQPYLGALNDPSNEISYKEIIEHSYFIRKKVLKFEKKHFKCDLYSQILLFHEKAKIDELFLYVNGNYKKL